MPWKVLGRLWELAADIERVEDIADDLTHDHGKGGG
jgi:hypothetical protein